jgi:hypothetical protein
MSLPVVYLPEALDDIDTARVPGADEFDPCSFPSETHRAVFDVSGHTHHQ